MKRLAIIPNLFLLILCVLFHVPSLKAESEFEKGVSLLRQQQYDEAIAAFSNALEAEPDDFEAHHNRGVAWFYKGEYDKAVADYTRALEINPNRAETYHNRGGARFYKSEYDQAISDYTRGLDISPNDSEAYNNRGAVWYYKGDYGKAIADHATALEINEDFAEAYQQMAWILATCPTEEYRDGTKAVDMARKAAALKPLPNILDTLAAAYAEAGQFEEAAKTQKEAIALLKEGGKTQSLTEYAERLETYENQQPWREKAVSQQQKSVEAAGESPETKSDEETFLAKQKDDLVQDEPRQSETPEALSSEPSEETIVLADAESKASETKTDEPAELLADAVASPDEPRASETEAEDELPPDTEFKDVDTEIQVPETKADGAVSLADIEFKASEPQTDEQVETLPDMPLAPEEPKISETGTVDELPLDRDFRFADSETQELESKADEDAATPRDAITIPDKPGLPETEVKELSSDEVEIHEDAELPSDEDIAPGPEESRKAEPVPDEIAELPPLEAIIPLADKLSDESAIRYPYTVHILSYPPDDREKANRVGERLRNEGRPAVTTPIYRFGKKSWHHVLIGFYETAEIAQKAASELRVQSFRSPRVLERPYAVLVGLFESDQELSELESDIRLKGYLAYKIPDTLDARKIRLLVGAFETADMAKISAENLEADGFETKIVER